MNEDQAKEALRYAMERMRRDHPEISERELDAIRKVIDNLAEGQLTDITFPWCAAMIALGREDIARAIVRVDVIVAPPVIMVGMGVQEGSDYSPNEASDEDQELISQAIMGTLRAAGWPAILEDGALAIDNDELRRLMEQDRDPWGSVVDAFRAEIDRLYPDKPSTQDPLSKWMKEDEE